MPLEKGDPVCGKCRCAFSRAVRVSVYLSSLFFVRVLLAQATAAKTTTDPPPSTGEGLGGRTPFVGEVNITGGSGSLEGEGKLMALPQNFGRSAIFMTEGKRLLKWLQNEGALNDSIVVELWERAGLRRSSLCLRRRLVSCFFCSSQSSCATLQPWQA